MAQELLVPQRVVKCRTLADPVELGRERLPRDVVAVAHWAMPPETPLQPFGYPAPSFRSGCGASIIVQHVPMTFARTASNEKLQWARWTVPSSRYRVPRRVGASTSIGSKSVRRHDSAGVDYCWCQASSRGPIFA